ncbi:MAG: glycoside hydrolase family 3 protein, partial [Firmicutes bacterium]|nr:glycoside hydrolase family 3 protein [Bacillota bacterium]
VRTDFDWDVKELLASMTLREKVGQLFIVRPEWLNLVVDENGTILGGGASVKYMNDTIADVLQRYPAGGVALYSRNIVDPQQIKELNAGLQAASRIPLYIAVDEEGGIITRIACDKEFSVPKYPSPEYVARTGGILGVQEMGSTIGSYMKEYGFNMNFAPVADVNTNPYNPIIGNRAFSSDPAVAAEMAAAFAKGLRQEGVIPVYKHFPGHGDTAEDSHASVAVSYKTFAELDAAEWRPFRKMTAADYVMVGHIALPNVTGDMTPATMSSQIINDILRKHLGFEGLIMPDSLVMQAITKLYSTEEAAVKTLELGCDIILDPANYFVAFDAVLNAVETGRISEEQLDAAVLRILKSKRDYGILELE